jgi:hypothetical protein|tara:strand:+ start:321 stop:863 length:543 start_codon:yes stop_codon:yes gene_type:complete
MLKNPKTDNTKYFKECNTRSSTISSRWPEVTTQRWVSHYGFQATPLPPEIWGQEELLKAVNEEFKFDNVGVVKLPPYFNYGWHRDTDRGCSINMLLSHDESHTLFQTEVVRENMDFRFTELKYKPDTFYIFNSQESHCVLNFKEPRFLFTCEFGQDKNELSYETLKNWVSKYETRNQSKD